MVKKTIQKKKKLETKKWWKEKPKDWQSLQIPKNSKQALWVSHAGVGSHVTVGILRKSW
jgi:hypothetical protein